MSIHTYIVWRKEYVYIYKLVMSIPVKNKAGYPGRQITGQQKSSSSFGPDSVSGSVFGSGTGSVSGAVFRFCTWFRFWTHFRFWTRFSFWTLNFCRGQRGSNFSEIKKYKHSKKTLPICFGFGLYKTALFYNMFQIGSIQGKNYFGEIKKQ